MTRPKRSPVASFGPELLALLVKGATERVEVPMKSRKDLQMLQLRIQMLRGAMGREKHPMYDLVQRARTARMWDGEPGRETNWRLIVQPHDIQFRDAILAAGIKVDEIALREVLEDTPSTVPADPSVEHARPDAGDLLPETEETPAK